MKHLKIFESTNEYQNTQEYANTIKSNLEYYFQELIDLGECKVDCSVMEDYCLPDFNSEHQSDAQKSLVPVKGWYRFFWFQIQFYTSLSAQQIIKCYKRAKKDDRYYLWDFRFQVDQYMASDFVLEGKIIFDFYVIGYDSVVKEGSSTPVQSL